MFKKVAAIILTICMSLAIVACDVGESGFAGSFKQSTNRISSEQTAGQSQSQKELEENMAGQTCAVTSSTGDMSASTRSDSTAAGSSATSSTQNAASSSDASTQKNLLANPASSSVASTSGTASATITTTQKPTTVPPTTSPPPKPKGELRGVWMAAYELSMIGVKGGETGFRNKINTMFSKAKDFGFNAVFVHVRGASDAFYKSNIYPWSYYITGKQGQDPGYDPLKIMVEIGHAKGLEVHAWVNPYAIAGSHHDPSKLAPNNPARKILEDNDPSNDHWIYISTGMNFNPAIPEVQKMIIDGIKEIVRNYDVDGIHFDDFFYPSTKTAIDEIPYEKYKNSGGKLSLSNWRRANVDAMVSGVYSAIKSIDKNVEFGISPQGNVNNNYYTLYADVYKWGSTKGYVDYLCPQIYFGFQHKTQAFAKNVETWTNICSSSSVKLYVGLAAYLVGTSESGAGGSADDPNAARFEWVNNDDVLSRQVLCARASSKYKGFLAFSYTYMFDKDKNRNVISEKEKLKALLT